MCCLYVDVRINYNKARLLTKFDHANDAMHASQSSFEAFDFDIFKMYKFG